MMQSNKPTKKDWEVIGITKQGRKFKKIITLGRLSDAYDVNQALLRSFGDINNIREITSIREIRTYAEGGEMETKQDLVAGYIDLSKQKPQVINDSVPTKLPVIDIVKTSEVEFTKEAISNSTDLVDLMKKIYGDTLNTYESFYAILLNQRNQPIYIYDHSKGGIAGTTVDPNLVLAVANKVLARGIVIFHNHPSGNLTPSQADRNITQKIGQACNLLDITLLDHIILTKDSYYSFADSGERLYAHGGMISEGSLVRVKKYGWIMRVDKIEGNLYYLENDRRGTMNGNVGSYSKDQLEAVMKDGGGIDSLVGRFVSFYFVGKDYPTTDMIYKVRLSDERYSQRDLILAFRDGTEARIPLAMVDPFLLGEQVKLTDYDGEPYVIELKKLYESSMPKVVRGFSDGEAYEYAKGGGVGDSSIDGISIGRLKSEFKNEKEIFDGKVVKRGLNEFKIVGNNFYLKRPNEEWQVFRVIKYANGGGVSGLKTYEVEFTWNKSDESDFDSRKVLIKAENLGQAQKLAKEKYGKYYEGFEILEVEKEEDEDEKYANGGGVGTYSKDDIEILGVPRNKISEKEWQSILRMAKYQNGAKFILKDSKGLDVKPQVEYEWYVKDKYAKGGGVGQFPPKGELKNKDNFLLKYEKKGSKYEFYIYKPITKGVSSYEQIKYVCQNKDCPTKMSYNQFINYLYAETYLDDKKYAKGGHTTSYKKTTFESKVKSIKRKLLERKKVPKAVQKDYGKTFSPAEAEDSAKRIVGAMRKKEMAKKKQIKYKTNI